MVPALTTPLARVAKLPRLASPLIGTPHRYTHAGDAELALLKNYLSSTGDQATTNLISINGNSFRLNCLIPG